MTEDEVPVDGLFVPVCLAVLQQAEGKDHKLLLSAVVCENKAGFRFASITTRVN